MQRVKQYGIRLIFALTLSLLSLGCGGQGSGRGGSSAAGGHISEPSGSPVIPVDVFVLTRSDGTGNEYFSEDYSRRMLDRASEYASDRMDFVLRHFIAMPDEKYEDNQTLVFLRYRNLVMPGFVSVVISQPYTTISAGVSAQRDANQTTTPFLVMRSRNPYRERFGTTGGEVFAPIGSAEDIDEVARIFLHELGHNMGLGHNDMANPSLPALTQNLAKQFMDSRDFNTDNYYRVDPQFLIFYAQKLRVVR